MFKHTYFNHIHPDGRIMERLFINIHDWIKDDKDRSCFNPSAITTFFDMIYWFQPFTKQSKIIIQIGIGNSMSHSNLNGWWVSHPLETSSTSRTIPDPKYGWLEHVRHRWYGWKHQPTICHTLMDEHGPFIDDVIAVNHGGVQKLCEKLEVS